MRQDEYIPIDSVEDLDPSKISIADINKRYIDRNGMRYATRFNLKTRKIEVVRIVKGKQEADLIRRQVVQQRTREQQHREQTRDLSTDTAGLAAGDAADTPTLTNEDFAVGPKGPPPNLAESANFVERDFMEACATDFEKVKERLQGIINFIKNSRYFESKGTPELAEAYRGIDVEGIQRSENAINYYKELTAYPRPVSYYMSRMAPDIKERLDQLADDEQKMQAVRRLESQTTFESTYAQVKQATQKLLSLLNDVPGDDLDLLPHNQHQAFDDAKAAATFLIENCVEKLNKIAIWKYKHPL